MLRVEGIEIPANLIPIALEIVIHAREKHDAAVMAFARVSSTPTGLALRAGFWI